MRKLLLTLLTLCIGSAAYAQLANGFYRIQSQKSKKYMALQNDVGHFIKQDGVMVSADLSSLVMVDESGVISDPATVFYIKRAEGNLYDLKAQGADTWDLSGQKYHITIDPGYCLRLIHPLATKTLGEKINSGTNNTVSAEGSSDFKWNILSVGNNFGVSATVFNGTKYYAPFYASFAFTPSAGMKAYYVGEIDIKHSVVILDEITGIVPAGTPVVIECSSMLPEQNKLTLKETGGTYPQVNYLKGVYFNYPGYNNIPARRTPYNPNTMRVLGLNDKKELVFKKASSNQPYLLANQSYLNVVQGYADEFRVMTRAEYKALPELTITINSVKREYGLGNPAFTYDVLPKNASGGVVKLICNATQYSKVGTYPITLDESSLANPKVNVVNGTLTITKAKLTATTGNYERMGGEENPDMSHITYTGFRNNENQTAIAVLPTVTCAATPQSKGGQYDVVASGGMAENYDFEYVYGKLTVYDFLIKVNDATRKYGDTNPAFTYTHMGELKGLPKIDTTADAYSSVGTYPINIERGTIENPWLKYEGATLTITPAEIIPQFAQEDYYITVGDPLPDFNISYYGFCNDDTPSTVITKYPTVSHSCKVDAAGRTLNVGTYRCSFGGDGRTKDGNYTFKTNASYAWLHVEEPKPIYIRAKSYTITYGDEIPEFEFTTEGEEMIGMPVLTCAATESPKAGVYDIVVEMGTVENRNVTMTQGKLTILPAPLTINAGEYVMYQGDPLPDIKMTFEGFVNGEDENTEGVFTTKPQLGYGVTANSSIGVYPVFFRNQGVAPNYIITHVEGKVEVKEALPVTIMADDVVLTYGQELPSSFTYTTSGATLRGEPKITCAAPSRPGAGSWNIKVEKGTVTNYDVRYVNGVLTVVKANLYAKVGNYERYEGEKNPEFKIEYEGFVYGENESVLLEKPLVFCRANASSPAGVYDIIIDTNGQADNYNIIPINGKLTVKVPAAIVELGTDGASFDVYTTAGVLVKKNATSLKGFAAGIYIVNGKKVVIK